MEHIVAAINSLGKQGSADCHALLTDWQVSDTCWKDCWLLLQSEELDWPVYLFAANVVRRFICEGGPHDEGQLPYGRLREAAELCEHVLRAVVVVTDDGDARALARTLSSALAAAQLQLDSEAAAGFPLQLAEEGIDGAGGDGERAALSFAILQLRSLAALLSEPAQLSAVDERAAFAAAERSAGETLQLLVYAAGIARWPLLQLSALRALAEWVALQLSLPDAAALCPELPPLLFSALSSAGDERICAAAGDALVALLSNTVTLSMKRREEVEQVVLSAYDESAGASACSTVVAVGVAIVEVSLEEVAAGECDSDLQLLQLLLHVACGSRGGMDATADVWLALQDLAVDERHSSCGAVLFSQLATALLQLCALHSSDGSGDGGWEEEEDGIAFRTGPAGVRLLLLSCYSLLQGELLALLGGQAVTAMDSADVWALDAALFAVTAIAQPLRSRYRRGAAGLPPDSCEAACALLQCAIEAGAGAGAGGSAPAVLQQTCLQAIGALACLFEFEADDSALPAAFALICAAAADSRVAEDAVDAAIAVCEVYCRQPLPLDMLSSLLQALWHASGVVAIDRSCAAVTAMARPLAAQRDADVFYHDAATLLFFGAEEAAAEGGETAALQLKLASALLAGLSATVDDDDGSHTAAVAQLAAQQIGHAAQLVRDGVLPASAVADVCHAAVAAGGVVGGSEHAHISALYHFHEHDLPSPQLLRLLAAHLTAARAAQSASDWAAALANAFATALPSCEEAMAFVDSDEQAAALLRQTLALASTAFAHAPAALLRLPCAASLFELAVALLCPLNSGCGGAALHLCDQLLIREHDEEAVEDVAPSPAGALPAPSLRQVALQLFRTHGEAIVRQLLTSVAEQSAAAALLSEVASLLFQLSLTFPHDTQHWLHAALQQQFEDGLPFGAAAERIVAAWQALAVEDESHLRRRFTAFVKDLAAIAQRRQSTEALVHYTM
eukprot:PLAT562.2.p1 GENE.PLAT562.2~~PLAT562.2.p1  ORF type:complete len:963 (+),score=468.10 PLAT562.2:66-2954(+)